MPSSVALRNMQSGVRAVTTRLWDGATKLRMREVLGPCPVAGGQRGA